MQDSNDTQSNSETGPSHLGVEIAVAVLTFGFGLLFLVGSLSVGIGWGVEGPRAGFFPFYVSLFIVVGSVINLVQVWRPDGIRTGLFSTWEQLGRVMSVVVPTSIYVVLIPFIGMYVASMILIAVFMMWLGGYRWHTTLPIAFGVPALVYIVFERYFLIGLPKGPIEELLGL